jgi:hypothetical protein
MLRAPWLTSFAWPAIPIGPRRGHRVAVPNTSRLGGRSKLDNLWINPTRALHNTSISPKLLEI